MNGKSQLLTNKNRLFETNGSWKQMKRMCLKWWLSFLFFLFKIAWIWNRNKRLFLSISRFFFHSLILEFHALMFFFTCFDILSSNFPAIFKGLLKHPAPLMILKNLPLTQLMIARSLTMVSFGRMDLSKYQFIFFPLFFSWTIIFFW